jgi:uncharacterized protein YdeI (YjbR/CyaY-like superfamily)
VLLHRASDMATIIPNPEKIRAFKDEAAFERWLSKHHARETELWLRLYKKGSGVASVTNSEAIDVALCWGWIDGVRKGLDDRSFLQRFSPRKGKSIWSKINRDRVARLTAAGRMTPHGQRHIDAAKGDGRWHAAYRMHGTTPASLPDDLHAAIAKNARARKNLETLARRDLFALQFRIAAMRTAAGRTRKIAELVAKLARGEPIAQQRKA